MSIAKSIWAVVAVSLLSTGASGQGVPSTQKAGIEIHVSPIGRDDGPGTVTEPLRTLAAAQQAARRFAGREPVTVLLHAGTYYLSDTLVLTAEDSGTKEAPMTYAAAPGEQVILSGGRRLDLRWEPFHDGIMKAKTPADIAIDQLFINGRRQLMARYPNFDPNVRHFNGYSADAFSRERAARWADPRGGFIHAMHLHEWGDFHYRITGKDAQGNVTYEGGWQNNRRMGMHAKYRMVENIFEELDAPGEWFHDAKTGTLYFCPPPGTDLATATVEVVCLRHLVESCDIFDTVKETGDHGSFNSWGRDHYWGLKDIDLNTVTLGENKSLPLLDVVKPIILRNSRWRCDHGWDIDLDDGSSNFEIRNNLCLNGGIKLREGFYRVCENNITGNNSFNPHVWYGNSQDIFRRNIVFGPYRPIRVNKPWGKECDFNLLHKPGQAHATPASGLGKLSGLDAGSIEADAMFIDPAGGDYRVREDSPALKLGFQNFPMDQFGVQNPALKAIARTPALPVITASAEHAAAPQRRITWKGAILRDLVGEEYSALGVGRDAGGVVVADVPADSEAAGARLRSSDFIRAVEGKSVRNVDEFLGKLREVSAGRKITLDVVRKQKKRSLEVKT